MGVLFATFVTLIWFCGEMAAWADEEDKRERGVLIKRTESSFAVRKKFTGFDLAKDKERKEKAKREKKEKAKAHWGKVKVTVPSLDTASLEGGAAIDLTPADASGTPRLLSARELQESASSGFPPASCARATHAISPCLTAGANSAHTPLQSLEVRTSRSERKIYSCKTGARCQKRRRQSCTSFRSGPRHTRWRCATATSQCFSKTSRSRAIRRRFSTRAS